MNLQAHKSSLNRCQLCSIMNGLSYSNPKTQTFISPPLVETNGTSIKKQWGRIRRITRWINVRSSISQHRGTVVTFGNKCANNIFLLNQQF